MTQQTSRTVTSTRNFKTRSVVSHMCQVSTALKFGSKFNEARICDFRHMARKERSEWDLTQYYTGQTWIPFGTSNIDFIRDFTSLFQLSSLQKCNHKEIKSIHHLTGIKFTNLEHGCCCDICYRVYYDIRYGVC